MARWPQLTARQSPFALTGARPLAPAKFGDPDRTATGAARARVNQIALRTLWLNTGTLCNIACANCYIESSPTNDRLAYLTLADALAFFDEIAAAKLPTRDIGFTGGEPFMNPDIIAMIETALLRGFNVLVLTNAMKPMRRHEAALKRLAAMHGDRLTLRVGLDHPSEAVHDAERGRGGWEAALDGLRWLAASGIAAAVAGRHPPGADDRDLRDGYRALFADRGIALDIDAPARLVLFPEMDATADVAEITTACWDILGKDPGDLMCATSRMVIRRKGDAAPRVIACTLLPDDPQFDLGATLAEASASVALNHPHCARFCVLGGASCAAG
ncbi:MAG: radical SAM protein [Sphingomonas sp.]|nr:radical SAM protein [Sphingomonas sp.]